MRTFKSAEILKAINTLQPLFEPWLHKAHFNDPNQVILNYQNSCSIFGNKLRLSYNTDDRIIAAHFRDIIIEDPLTIQHVPFELKFTSIDALMYNIKSCPRISFQNCTSQLKEAYYQVWSSTLTLELPDHRKQIGVIQINDDESASSKVYIQGNFSSARVHGISLTHLHVTGTLLEVHIDKGLKIDSLEIRTDYLQNCQITSPQIGEFKVHSDHIYLEVHDFNFQAEDQRFKPYIRRTDFRLHNSAILSLHYVEIQYLDASISYNSNECMLYLENCEIHHLSVSNNKTGQLRHFSLASSKIIRSIRLPTESKLVSPDIFALKNVYVELMESYELLYNFAKDNGLHDESIFYRKQSQNLRRRTFGFIDIRKYVSIFYKLFSDYGTSILLPLIWIFIGGYLAFFLYGIIEAPINQQNSNLISRSSCEYTSIERVFSGLFILFNRPDCEVLAQQFVRVGHSIWTALHVFLFSMAVRYHAKI